MTGHFDLGLSEDIAPAATLDHTNSASDNTDLITDDNALTFNDGRLPFDSTDWPIDDTGSTLYDIDLVLDVDASDIRAEAHFPSVALHQNIEEHRHALPGGAMGGNECSKDQPGFRTPENDSQTASKVGKRFTSASVRVLNNWLMSHVHRPYPAVGDIERLERLSGLSKQQILNWFSNARRRKKFPLSRTPAYAAQSSATPPLGIPQRPPTPTVGHTVVEHMNPLERWQNSPPENEPANAAVIARAVSDMPTVSGELTRIRSTDDRLLQSVDNASSISSVGTSDSSRSSGGSAYSQTSQASRNSFSYLRKTRKRRKRATTWIESTGPRSLFRASHPFQCTFCTETFKTKHNWQRHEKSLHLSLEQWQCSPYGPTAVNADLEPVCVYCGLDKPNGDHLDAHNYDSCQNRQIEERTFYRKDHLIQHLRLMHGAQFRKWPMEEWKLDQSGEILSQCGFCNLHLSSWAERADHLADHFKEGKTMADWKGDWGFEAPVLDMVENSMPPYLINYERNSPLPFTTQQGAPNSPTSAFELIQLELDYFFTNRVEANHSIPTNEALQCEACCIIFGAEVICRSTDGSAPSWLRDLIMSSEEITREARLRPMKSAAKSRLTRLKIHGKDDIFEKCQLENLLRQHVDMLQLLNFEVEDGELQREAYNIVNQMPSSSALFVKLLFDLIYSSTSWLVPFRVRAKLEPTQSLPHVIGGENPVKQNAFVAGADLCSERLGQGDSSIGQQQVHPTPLQPRTTNFSGGEPWSNVGIGSKKVGLLNDSNMYRELTRELSRFVASAMSPLNPTCHKPTDQELQYQARWIMYDDDDPWNQTPADNPDWLRDFKRDAGL
ncbi:hypothetical protein EDB81DRAFT_850878 [Dactylonectria macrodidyma]|uniref:Uncharacterized protein n=1 Tax=Dactylonectria macrodidyma TaxID=307937 RepID=A0A9P9FMB6_9HYPO|nr:hypothetical protein EDB81DRAFT_850878 [Dactylonectria macrodidyma]